MNEPKQSCVLVLGNSKTHEMGPVLEAVGEVCLGARLFYDSSVKTISPEIESPELIVICQNWPDEFSVSELNDLIKRFPISRLVCCYGVWCESDGRTRDVWPLSVRVPARCARVRIQQEWDIVQGNEKAFPLTAGRDEIFEFERSAKSCKLDLYGDSPLIRIESGDRSYQVMLEELVVSWGARVAVRSQRNKADLVIYDLDPWELIESVIQASPAPMIGMMGLAHTETMTVARMMGFETIICKVAPERTLFQTVARILKIKECPQEAC